MPALSWNGRNQTATEWGRTMSLIDVKFMPEDIVVVKDEGIKGHINRVSILNAKGYYEFEVRWWSNGSLVSAWFMPSQLESSQ
jgi:hypothetical protein